MCFPTGFTQYRKTPEPECSRSKKRPAHSGAGTKKVVAQKSTEGPFLSVTEQPAPPLKKRKIDTTLASIDEQKTTFSIIQPLAPELCSTESGDWIPDYLAICSPVSSVELDVSPQAEILPTPLFPPVPLWNDNKDEIYPSESELMLTTADSPARPEGITPFQEEIVQLFDAIHHFKLVDIDRCLNKKELKEALRNEEILIYFKDLIETHRPAATPSEQFINVQAKAEAARRLRFIRCDDWCYFFLAHWLRSPSCFKETTLIELTLPQACSWETDSGEPDATKDCNHYALLVSSSGQSLPRQFQNLSSLMKSDKVSSGLAKMLEKGDFWIVDPAINWVTPATRENLKRHIQLVCSKYGYLYTGNASLSPVESLSKPHSVLESDVQKSNNIVQELLPVAGLLWSGGQVPSLISLKSKLFYLGIKPKQLCSKLDVEKWSAPALRCLTVLLPQYNLGQYLPEQALPSDLDLARCSRTDSQEYVNALRNRILTYLGTGKSAEECFKRLSRFGFHGSDAISDDFRYEPYLIPAIDAIPQELHNTTDWEENGKKLFQMLGINPDKGIASLKDVLIRFWESSRNIYDVSNAISPWYKNLYIDRKELKEAILEKSFQSVSLIRHLIYVCKVSIPQSLKENRYLPLDSLSVCRPDSDYFQKAMSQFIVDGLNQGQTPSDLAATLNKQGYLHSRTKHGESKVKLNALLSVEKPSHLAPEFSWRACDIEKIIKDECIDTLSPKQALAAYIRDLLARRKGGDTPEERGSRLIKDFMANKSKRTKLAKMLHELIPDLCEERAICFPRYLLRVAVQYAGIDAKKECGPHLLMNKYDDLAFLKAGSPVWKVLIKKLVKHYLRSGHSLSYVARRLNKGDKRSINQYTVPPAASPSGEEWNYDILIQFLRDEKIAIEDLILRYPKMARCLAMEHTLSICLTDKFTTEDGLIIDGIQGGHDAHGAPESSKRFDWVSQCLNLRVPETRNRYAELKKITESRTTPAV